ncbi:tryptophanyl-tRNA synthetase [Streptococcus rupicaprae]|uniref:Tryptophanyl-tRNA synthetase n=1 Tax=Streptococcus rupicaprae TaxID=759619 RepID=A0ABV2FFP7_9STRE
MKEEFGSKPYEYEVHHIIEKSEYTSYKKLNKSEIHNGKNLLLVQKKVHQKITDKTNPTRITNKGRDESDIVNKYYKLGISTDSKHILLENLYVSGDIIILKINEEVFFELDSIDDMLAYNKEQIEKFYRKN